MLAVISTFGSVVVLLWCMATCPDRLVCPKGWWIPDGVRPSGAFTCRPTPIGGEYRDARGIVHDVSAQPPGAVSGQVYCGTARPELVPVIERDGRTVSCEHVDVY